MQPANNGQPAEQGQKQKRERSVFPTEQVAHLWANGVEREVRNGNGSISTSANGRLLYSYSTCVAQRTETRDPEGRAVYLITNRDYSATTRRHVSNAARAVPFHVCYISSTGAANGWDGRREGITSATELHLFDGAASAATSAQVLTFHVPDASARTPQDHAHNFKVMFQRAASAAEEMARRREHFYPAQIAHAFRNAFEYRALFCADYAEDLGASYPWEALAARYARACARKDKAERDAAAARAQFKAREDEWMRRVAPTLTDLRASLAEPTRALGLGLRDAVERYETTGVWEVAGETSPAEARVRALVEHLIKSGSADFEKVATRYGFKVMENAHRALGIAEAAAGVIRPPYWLDPWPTTPTRNVFGRQVPDFYSNKGIVWEALGIPRHSAWHQPNPRARLVVGRDLLCVSADGREVITSGGARVPVGIVAALWRRHGAEILAAAAEPCALTFPEARRVGAFAWIGYDLGDSAAAATGGGASALVIGCHKVGAEDVARLARRLGWPEPEAVDA